jgi:hypothetical protein
MQGSISTAEDSNLIDLEDVYTPLDKCILNNRAFRSMPIAEVMACRKALDTAISIYIDAALQTIDVEHSFVQRFATRLVSKKMESPGNDLLAIVTTNWDIMRNPLKSAIRSGNKKPLSHSANSLSQTML